MFLAIYYDCQKKFGLAHLNKMPHIMQLQHIACLTLNRVENKSVLRQKNKVRSIWTQTELQRNGSESENYICR